ncbi:MAG TPA: ammonium transporter [Candidatus Bathyarchaeia archaeon]|nr:ammonium transporter [Candidatus Bathyarchaeia archaeon]
MSSGDTGYLLISAALVMLMIPGLAFFYSGMVRAKNVLATALQSFFALGIVSVLWVLIAYSLAFGPDVNGLIGNLSYVGFHGVGQDPNPALAATVPHLAFAIFQLFFAAITPALITGAFAERMKFSAFALFTSLWLILVYAPLAHWVWAPGGWIRSLGALDFAGGTVVHISAGIAALAAALIIGKRKGLGKKGHAPHNLPFTMLGAGLLWFGWFGFNAGSALTAGGLASVAFVTTNVATGAAMLGWAFVDWMRHRRVTSLGAVSGAVAGLVAITPAAGFVSPLSAILIGLAAGVICAYAVGLKLKLGFDDTLDVVGVHAVGGIVGALSIGFVASTAVNSAGANGLFHGGGLTLLGHQAIAVGAAVSFAFVASWILLKLIDMTIGLRVSPNQEIMGLDKGLHDEDGYVFAEPAPAYATASRREK